MRMIIDVVQNDIYRDCEHHKHDAIFKTRTIVNCIKDVEGVVTAAEDIIKIAKSHDINIDKILNDARTIVKDIKFAEHDCTFSTDVKTKLRDLPSCMADVEDIVT